MRISETGSISLAFSQEFFSRGESIVMQISFIVYGLIFFAGGKSLSGKLLEPPSPVEERQFLNFGEILQNLGPCGYTKGSRE